VPSSTVFSAAHPDFRTEAEQAARSLLSQVSFESVADDVEHALRSPDLDDLGSRAGRHRGGYTSPAEAAWELLQEAVDPFLSDISRQMELGLGMEAREIRKGVVLVVYRIRDSRGDECLGWAEDLPTEAAADAAHVLAWGGRKGVGRTRRARPYFDEEFVAKKVPEWATSSRVRRTGDDRPRSVAAMAPGPRLANARLVPRGGCPQGDHDTPRLHTTPQPHASQWPGDSRSGQMPLGQTRPTRPRFGREQGKTCSGQAERDA